MKRISVKSQTAINYIDATNADEEVITFVSLKVVITSTAIEIVISPTTEYCVVTCDATKDVIAIVADKEVVSVTTSEQVVPANCLLYTSPSPRDQRGSRMPSSA